MLSRNLFTFVNPSACLPNDLFNNQATQCLQKGWPLTHLKLAPWLIGLHHALTATLLNQLLRKYQFLWHSDSQAAFDQLKHAMTTALVLVPLDFSIPFMLEIDACGFTMGVVLAQQHHPISFFSKLFYPRLQCNSTYARELHTITIMVRKWRHYLLGHPFVILADHQSLKELMTQVIQTPEQQTYLSKLQGHNYTIEYRSNFGNVAADVLSRMPHRGQLLTLSLQHSISWQTYKGHFSSPLFFWTYGTRLGFIQMPTRNIPFDGTSFIIIAKFGFLLIAPSFLYYCMNTILQPWGDISES